MSLCGKIGENQAGKDIMRMQTNTASRREICHALAATFMSLSQNTSIVFGSQLTKPYGYFLRECSWQREKIVTFALSCGLRLGHPGSREGELWGGGRAVVSAGTLLGAETEPREGFGAQLGSQSQPEQCLEGSCAAEHGRRDSSSFLGLLEGVVFEPLSPSADLRLLYI